VRVPHRGTAPARRAPGYFLGGTTGDRQSRCADQDPSVMIS